MKNNKKTKKKEEKILVCPYCKEPLSNLHYGYEIESYRCNNTDDCPISDVIITKGVSS